jgi:hypothetical protein
VLPDSECASWGSGELGTSRASNRDIDNVSDETGDTSDHGSAADVTVTSCGKTVRAGGGGSQIPECDSARVMHGTGMELIGGVRGAVSGEVGAADSGQTLSLFQRSGNSASGSK